MTSIPKWAWEIQELHAQLGLGDLQFTGPIGSERFRNSSFKRPWKVQDLQVQLDLRDSGLPGQLGMEGSGLPVPHVPGREVHNFQAQLE